MHWLGIELATLLSQASTQSTSHISRGGRYFLSHQKVQSHQSRPFCWYGGMQVQILYREWMFEIGMSNKILAVQSPYPVVSISWLAGPGILVGLYSKAGLHFSWPCSDFCMGFGLLIWHSRVFFQASFLINYPDPYASSVWPEGSVSVSLSCIYVSLKTFLRKIVIIWLNISLSRLMYL